VHTRPVHIIAEQVVAHLLLHLRQRVAGPVTRNARRVPGDVTILVTA
jgi:hypothetical protein